MILLSGNRMHKKAPDHPGALVVKQLGVKLDLVRLLLLLIDQQ